MTFEYIPRWREVQEEIEGASQRIQEDTYRFAKIVEYLGLQIVNAFMTLVAFLPILWDLSHGISVPIIQDLGIVSHPNFLS
jgi:peptide/bleomycin uptake transporter